MEIPAKLRCLFSARLEERDGSYVVEVPEGELQSGQIRDGETYRVALLPSSATDEATRESSAPSEPARDRDPESPPVTEGETRTVEVEDIGEQGDGITRVERGFVVIVPDTERGERVTIEITDVRENVAFAEVVDRVSYYD